MKKTQDVKVEVVVQTEYIRDQVVSRISERVSERVDAEIETAVQAAVIGQVEKIGRSAIAKAVADVLAEGWPRTDSYGSVSGKATLKDRISELLNGRDRYNSSEKWLQELVKKTTEEYLKGEFKKDIDAAREKLRSEVDGVTRAKLNEALRTALGVGA